MVRSYLLLLFCVTVWGSNFVFGAILVDNFPPMLLAVTRLLLTCSIYVVMAAASRRFEMPTRQDWKLLVPIGAMGVLVNQSCFYIGMQDADPTSSSLLLSLSPIVIGLLAAVFLGERLTLRMSVGSVVAVSGVFFVVSKGGSIHLSVGELWIFGAMLSFTIATILTRKLLERRDAFFVTAYSTVIGTVMLIPVAFARDRVADMSTDVWAWVMLVVTALVMQVVCGLVWNRGAGRAAVFLNLQPFVAMSLGYAVLGTPVTIRQGIGSLLIIGGVLFATYRRKQDTKPSGRTESTSVTA
ncbi:MAG: EamA-like transporter family protein [Paenibacillus sp.]|nr:EamA-like transporter family protein [Paenibacillus sp.]